MNDRIKRLYQEHILEKAKDSTLEGTLEKKTHEIEGYNPMCGDKFRLSMRIKENKVEDVRYSGNGCAISKASTVVLAETLLGKSIKDIRPIVFDFLELINEKGLRSPSTIFDEPRYLAFAAAREFPERRTCASLCWDKFDSHFFTSKFP